MNKKHDEIDNLFFEYFENNTDTPNIIIDGIKTALYTEKSNYAITSLIKKIIITILSIIGLCGGIAIAGDYIFKTFGLGKGIDTAAKNGYILQQDISAEKKVDETDTEITIKEFLMDDQNLSTKFSFKFNSNSLESSNIKNIELKDLIITDENNVILYCGNEKALNEFCQNNNVQYKFEKFNDNYFNCGLNSFLAPSSEENIIILNYNIYSNNYPKSKKLKYKFQEIEITENEEQNSNKKILEGNWEFNIDVPEKMYNRQKIAYKVLNCSDENVEVSTAQVSDTGFEFGCIIKNAELPDELKQLKEQIENLPKLNISEEEKEKLISKYMNSHLPLSPINSTYYPDLGETIEDCTYIENQKNQKFLLSRNPGRIQQEKFIDNGKTFILYETFDITKYDITDEVRVHLNFYYKQINIQLKKIS